MCDEITKAERALIDAAIAAGKVQEVALGVSAFPTPVWTGHKLEYATPEDAAMFKMRRLVFGAAPSAKIATRRAKVIEMHKSGMTPKQIAAELGETIDLIQRDIRQAGLSPRQGIDREWIKSEVARMHAEGMRRQDVADALGLSNSSLRRVLVKLGLKFSQFHPDHPYRKERAERKAEAIRLHKAGLGTAEISKRVGVTQNHIAKYLREGTQ